MASSEKGKINIVKDHCEANPAQHYLRINHVIVQGSLIITHIFSNFFKGDAQ